MHRLILVALIGLASAACPDPDAERRGEPATEAVDMDTLAWVREGRLVEHEGDRWAIVGPPAYEPRSLTRTGEFEGTPLYAELGAEPPRRRLYIPLGGGYWQMLERIETMDPTLAPDADPDVQPGTEGVVP